MKNHLHDMVNRQWCRVPVAFSFLIVSACFVIKENRNSCPCFLTVELTGTRGRPSTVLVSVPDSVFTLHSFTGDSVLNVSVPRGPVAVTAFAGGVPGDWDALGPGGSFRIPLGEQSPPLFLDHCRFVASGEEVTVKAKLRKQFCTLELAVQGPPGMGSPFSVRIRGVTEGLEFNGALIEGPFCCDAPVSAGKLRLPRQAPDSPLLLDITMPDQVLRTFSLGSALLKAGYDWTTPDLEDIAISLDLSVTTLTLSGPSLDSPTSISVEI